MSENSNGDSSGNHELLLLAGGFTLMAIGAGLVLSHPAVRKTLGTGISNLAPDIKGFFTKNLSDIVPDIQRYMKLRSM